MMTSTLETVWGAILALLDARGQLTRAAFNELISEHELPARDFGPLTRRLADAGVPIVEAAAEDDEDDLPDIKSLDAEGTRDFWEDFFDRLMSHDLLSPEQERDAGMRIQRGILADRALEQELPKEARRALISQMRDGVSAQHELMLHNMRLVVHVAKRYQGQGLDFQDLISEGVLGLKRAVELFDPTTGNRFSTYAIWWIRQAVGRGVMDRGSLIRIPVHRRERLRKFVAITRRLETELGRDPSKRELADALETDLAEVDELLRCWMLVRPMGMDAPVTADGFTLAETFADDADPETDVINRDTATELDKVLRTLPEREQRIIALRYGLKETEPATLDEIGMEFGLTRERIRQLQNRAIESLQHTTRRSRLEGLLS